MTDRGVFITFEGIEGAGKSTQIERVAEQLRAAGRTVTKTREPGGTPFAEQIRGLVLEPIDEPMGSMTELLLIFAARAQHLHTCIGPALEAGHWVLCDRFTDASFAYQGAGRGMPVTQIETLQTLVQGELRPDRVFVLDLPVPLGLARAAARNEKEDRFESERAEFFDRVRAAYLARAQADPARYRIVDASGTVDEVSAALSAEVQNIG